MRDEPSGMVGKIVELLKLHPEGLTSGEIREKLGIPAHEQAQLDRRRREVRDWYNLESVPNGGNPRYRLGTKIIRVEKTNINGRQKAEVLHLAKGRCQMCGKSVAEDGIRLQIDHKLPQAWGGTNDLDNLWALCTECNHGKKDLFSSQDESVQSVMKYRSVHMRIGELLKLNLGQWVHSRVIEFVANQDDWPKRTRDLRYLGWDVDVTVRKQPNGRMASYYKVTKFNEWPEDPTRQIRDFEKNRAIRNRQDPDAR